MFQKNEFDKIYNLQNTIKFNHHITSNKLIRFLRDRRLEIAINAVKKIDDSHSFQSSILIFCGGVGGEAYYFINKGYIDVTNSDYIDNVHIHGEQIFNSSFKTLQFDAMNSGIPDSSYDYTIVQDGLHHLSCPVQGMVEMLRISKKGVIVIEPHTGIIGDLFGTDWEIVSGVYNWVFRWNKNIFSQSVKSYLLKSEYKIIVKRIFDHNLLLLKLINKLPKSSQLLVAQLIYSMLYPFNFLGNMFIGIIVKNNPKHQIN